MSADATLSAMEDSQRLADVVCHRRLALGLTLNDAAALAGMSHVTWTRIESGRSVKRQTLAKLDAPLQWTPGSARRTFAGGEPSPLEGEVPTPELRDEDERGIWGLRLPAPTRLALIDLKRRHDDIAERAAAASA